MRRICGWSAGRRPTRWKRLRVSFSLEHDHDSLLPAVILSGLNLLVAVSCSRRLGDHLIGGRLGDKVLVATEAIQGLGWHLLFHNVYGSKKTLLAAGHDEETRCGEPWQVLRGLAVNTTTGPPPILVSKWTGPVSGQPLSLVAGDI